MRPKPLFSLSLSLLLLAATPGPAQAPTSPPQSARDTFRNPLLPSGPDPWVISYKGMYYYMNTTGVNITLWATPDITDLRHATTRVVWVPPATGPYSKEIWAPELHRFDNRWYLYFTADAGRNEGHRIWVLENASDDPMEGAWTLKGQIEDSGNHWAIDPSAFEVHGQKYLIWSGWKGDRDGEQDIYIGRLKNPWTLGSERVQLSSPQYPWELVGDLPDRPAVPHVSVNEGPEMLEHGDDLFLTYSASACWTDYYSLGVLHAKADTDLLNPSSWTKYDHPFFRQDPANGVFGPGHNGFFKSPDGQQDWIIYHANSARHEGCGDKRSPRAQPITWNPDGTPNFGQPVPVDTPLPKPSR